MNATLQKIQYKIVSNKPINKRGNSVSKENMTNAIDDTTKIINIKLGIKHIATTIFRTLIP